MNPIKLDNYLRPQRRKAGLSLRELGVLLAYDDEGTVSRHERSKTLPPLLIALGYEVIFQAPVSILFPGVMETVELTVEKRLLRFEEGLRQQLRKDSQDLQVNQKLTWLNNRSITRKA
jgi:hypothetical protein